MDGHSCRKALDDLLSALAWAIVVLLLTCMLQLATCGYLACRPARSATPQALTTAEIARLERAMSRPPTEPLSTAE